MLNHAMCGKVEQGLHLVTFCGCGVSWFIQMSALGYPVSTLLDMFKRWAYCDLLYLPPTLTRHLAIWISMYLHELEWSNSLGYERRRGPSWAYSRVFNTVLTSPYFWKPRSDFPACQNHVMQMSRAFVKSLCATCVEFIQNGWDLGLATSWLDHWLATAYHSLGLNAVERYLVNNGLSA